MMLTESVGQTIIGAFKVDERFQLNSANYYDFMDKSSFVWYKSQRRIFIVNCVFMYDNVPSNVNSLNTEGYRRENNWMATIKSRFESDQLWIIWKGDKQYNRNSNQWEASKSNNLGIEPTGKKLMDNRLMVFIEKKSHYIKM